VEKFVTARQATDDNITRRMRFACWITKATDTHSEYVILNTIPRQQWLSERASLLHLYEHLPVLFTQETMNARTVSFEYLKGIELSWDRG
jgi:hypothetical protein